MLVLNRHFKVLIFFFFSSRRRHTRSTCDWSSDVCSSDLLAGAAHVVQRLADQDAAEPSAAERLVDLGVGEHDPVRLLLELGEAGELPALPELVALRSDRKSVV